MKKPGFIVIPLMILAPLTSCSSPPLVEEYTVTFDSNGGSPVAQIVVEAGKTITPPADPHKDSTPEFTYQFEEWQLDDERFDFANTPINDDIILQAKWNNIKNKYTVTFDSAGGSDVDPIVVDYNEIITPPANPSKEDKIWEYQFDGWYTLSATPFDFAKTPITSDITLQARWSKGKRKKYTATAENGTHLLFSTLEKDNDFKDVEIVAGEAFVFQMAINDTSNDLYKVPTALSICIGDSDVPLSSGYQVKPDSEKKTAIVVIDGEVIDGKITITGEAVLTECYEIDLKLYGIDSDLDVTYARCDSNKIITLHSLQEADYGYPEEENIYLNFDNTKWIAPSSTSEYCTYDSSSHRLTISKDKADSNVTIIIRAPKYPLLDKEFSWAEISDYSTRGWAPYMFYLGEQKSVVVNGITHKVRIIGFNHDVTTDEAGSLAGITFEFANIISDKNGYSLAAQGAVNGGNNHDFLNSNLRKALDGEGKGKLTWYEKGQTSASTTYQKPVIDMLPSNPNNPDLKEVLKEVIKPITLFNDSTKTYYVDTDSYKTKLFLLSYNEITTNRHEYAKDGGLTYDIYKEDGDTNANRIKWQIKHKDGAITDINKLPITLDNITNYAGYNFKKVEGGGLMWLRSPYTYKDITRYTGWQWSIADQGNITDLNILYTVAYGVAPAFCV